MRTGTKRLDSTKFARYRRRSQEVLRVSWRTTSRPSRNLAPTINLEIHVPERKQQVDLVVQWTRLGRRTRGINTFPNYIEELGGQRMVAKVPSQRGPKAESIMIKIYNSAANYFPRFQYPREFEKRMLQYTEEIGKNLLLRHDIWVHESEDRDKDSFQGRKSIYGGNSTDLKMKQIPGRHKSRVSSAVGNKICDGIEEAQSFP
ncbi:hypothetical protein HOY80DRAFT_1063569 [Tuber brumale]|nr:hypothetical protein HOY80DRAFT_1063569 [Tuber brumale]